MKRRAHLPVRSCVGCGARTPQADLLRLASAPDGVLMLVHARGHVGRTAYLHPYEACWKQFAARKGLVRSLRRPIDKAKRLAFVQELKRISESAMIK